MALSISDIDSLPAVEGELNYLAPSVHRPRTYTSTPPEGEPQTTIVNETYRVKIHNARPAADSLSLDEEGFALIEQRSAVRDFYDDAQIRDIYYPEAERTLKSVTGASRVFIFDHTVRRRIPGAVDQRDGLRQPVTRVHVDHTAKSGPQRVRDLLPDEADELLRGRVQIINLWRPIRGPLHDSPLAVCDARTVDKQELVASDLVYPNRIGETYSVTYSKAHKWLYVPEMRADEALLLKCYDSHEDGRARFAPHSAFHDPSSPRDAAPRESIELRTLVFHSH